LLVSPRSLASALTRTFDTFLLSKSVPGGADRRQYWGVLIAEYSSGAHQRQTRFRSRLHLNPAARGPRSTPRPPRHQAERWFAAHARTHVDGRRDRSTRHRDAARRRVPNIAPRDRVRRHDRHVPDRGPLAGAPTACPPDGTRCRYASGGRAGAQSGRYDPLYPDGGVCRTGASAGRPPASVSGRMSMRHPVSLAASLAFWPSRPIARESW
jgi:hypothetical protein